MRWLGKRLVFAFDDELFLILHLMIAGRLHWKPRAKLPAKIGLAASSCQRNLDPDGGGIESAPPVPGSGRSSPGRPQSRRPRGLTTDLATFAKALTRETHREGS